MAYRVIQWATGNVGLHSLRSIIEHPELELAGLWVHSPEKAGQDAGTLAGVDPAGVEATDDADALLAVDADCVAYMATADLRPQEAIDDIARILESGKNVVSSSAVFMVYPPAAPDGWVRQLEDACAAGGTSCFTSGIDPGFANDLLPLTLTGFSQRVDSVRMMEVVNYATYDQPTVLFETMGFGKPLDHTPLLLAPGSLSLAWGPTVAMIADGLGVELDGVEEWHEREPAPETFEIAPGTVEKGTMAALHFEVRGIVGGEPRIVLEHVTRLRDDLAPSWPQPTGAGGYRVIVEGSPTWTLDLQMMGEDGDHNTAGVLGTAMRVLNAIPAVCEAEPGLLTPFDLPLITGKGLMPTS